MPALRVVMLLVTVLICYLLFFYSAKVATPSAEALPPDAAATGSPSTAHSQYKEALDRAHAAAKAMQTEHKDADSELGAVPSEK